MAAVLTYLRSALQQQKQALSPLPVLPVPQACDSSHFSLSLSLSRTFSTRFLHRRPEQYLFTRHHNVAWVTVTVVNEVQQKRVIEALDGPVFDPGVGNDADGHASDKPAAVTPSFTHTHTENLCCPEHWMTPFFLPFFSPPKVIMIFYIPAFLLYSCTVKQSLPFFPHS